MSWEYIFNLLSYILVSEEKFLHQIHLEEQYGSVVTQQRAKEDEKKKLSEKKAAIAYTYEDSTPQPPKPAPPPVLDNQEPEPEEDEEDVSDIDFGECNHCFVTLFVYTPFQRVFLSFNNYYYILEWKNRYGCIGTYR